MRVDSLSSLLKGSLPPILFLFGEEEFLLDEAYSQIFARVAKMGISDFDIDIVDGEEVSADHIVAMASAFPMMSERRIVVVKHIDKAVGGRRSKSAEKSPLAAYLRNPSPSCGLILLTTAGSSANEDLKGISAAAGSSKAADKAQARIKKLKFPYNLLIEHADWIEFPKMPDRLIGPWITKRATSLGREISAEAAEFILARSGNSLRDLANELDKIALYVGDKKSITLDDILHLVGDSREYNIFELQKAVGERSLTKSLDILQHMMKNDRNEVMIVTMLTRFFLSLWKLIDAASLSTNSFEISKQTGIHSFFVPEYLGVLNRYSGVHIENAFFALRDADRRIKSTSDDALILLQQMLIRIMHDPAKA